MAGRGRHDHARHLQLARERGGVHRAAAAEGDDRKVARVAAAADGNELEQVDHVRVRDADDAERRLLDGDVELLGEGPQSLAGAIDVELDLAAEEVARVDAAGDHVRIGESGLGPAPTVGRRSGVRARALRAYPERAGRVEPRDRAASGPDLDDVDDRHLHRIAGGGRCALDVIVAGQPERAALDERRLRGRAADVERDQVLLPEQPSDRRCADDPADGAGLDQVDRRPPGALEAGDTAVRLHRVADALGDPGVSLQELAEPFEVLARRRLHVGVEHRRRGAVELAPLARQLVRRGHCGFGPLGADDFRGSPLVRVVRVGVQEADRHRLRALAPGGRNGGADALLVERREGLALVAHPLGDLEPEPPWDKRLRLRVGEVVEVRPVRALDLEHVPEPLRRQERGRGALPLRERVDDHGRPVGEELDRAEVGLGDRVHHALLEAAGSGRALRKPHAAACLVEVDEVGERSADVDRAPRRQGVVLTEKAGSCAGFRVTLGGLDGRAPRTRARSALAVSRGRRPGRPQPLRCRHGAGISRGREGDRGRRRARPPVSAPRPLRSWSTASAGAGETEWPCRVKVPTPSDATKRRRIPRKAEGGRAPPSETYGKLGVSASARASPEERRRAAGASRACPSSSTPRRSCPPRGGTASDLRPRRPGRSARSP